MLCQLRRIFSANLFEVLEHFTDDEREELAQLHEDVHALESAMHGAPSSHIADWLRFAALEQCLMLYNL